LNKFVFLVLAFLSPLLQGKELIIGDDSYVISKRVSSEFTELTIEFINQYKGSLDGKYPDRDFVVLLMDVNQNSQIDKDLDTYYATSENGLCSGYLIDKKFSSTCGAYKSDFDISRKLLATKLQKRPHPVFKFTIPNKELFGERDNAALVFKIHSSVSGYTYYPDDAEDESLNTTVLIER